MKIESSRLYEKNKLTNTEVATIKMYLLSHS